MNIAGAAILAAITMANAKSPSPIDLSEVDLKAVIEDVLEANPNADTAEIEAGVYDVLEDIGAGELVEEARAVVPPIIGNLRRFPVVFGDPSDDLIALRFVVPDITTCYLTLGIIHSLFKPMEGRFKDYIATPKQNGYQSLHTTVITPDKQIVEFQIRTQEMHDYAERGLAASFYYNEQKLTTAYTEGRISKLPTNLLWIKELQEATAKLSHGDKIDAKKLKLNLFSDKIFVYTPKGDIIDLPKGAMPLDFAYRLHTEIGARCTGVKINGKMCNLNTKLQQGDIVEIITAKNTQPNPGWLEKVFSSHARSKILSQLRKALPGGNRSQTSSEEIIPKNNRNKPKTNNKSNKPEHSKNAKKR